MPENIILECPFCHKKTVNVIYYPSILQASTSRAAGRTVTKYYKTKEKYEVLSDCSNCGKKIKEIQKALEGEKKDPDKEKEIIERLKKQGLFMDEIKQNYKSNKS
ncbi:MAG: hypothetical protein QXM68_03035 [Candidatus Aenigmatarchaeota archaeon]|nr:hypothetical protein [Candidatus Aenigmarchaeota archaeon]